MKVGDIIKLFEEFWIITEVSVNTEPEIFIGESFDGHKCQFTVDDINYGGDHEVV